MTTESARQGDCRMGNARRTSVARRGCRWGRTAAIVGLIMMIAGLIGGVDNAPGFPENKLPILGLPEVVLDRRVLRILPESTPDEKRTAVRVLTSVKNVHAGGWRSTVFVPVYDAITAEVVTVVASETQQLPRGVSAIDERLTINPTT